MFPNIFAEKNIETNSDEINVHLAKCSISEPIYCSLKVDFGTFVKQATELTGLAGVRIIGVSSVTDTDRITDLVVPGSAVTIDGTVGSHCHCNGGHMATT